MDFFQNGDDFNQEDSEVLMKLQALRLQGHIRALREKLNREKLLLANLKAETEAIVSQKSVFVNGHLPQCPMSRRQESGDYFNQSVSPEPSYVQLVSGQGDFQDFGSSSAPMVDSSGTELDECSIIRQLDELDDMCRLEMAKIHEVGHALEPFKQIASDWNLQAELSKAAIETTKPPKVSRPSSQRQKPPQVTPKPTVSVEPKKEYETFTTITTEIDNIPTKEETTHKRPEKSKENKPEETPVQNSAISQVSKDVKRAENISEGKLEKIEKVVPKITKKKNILPISWRRMVVDRKKMRLATKEDKKACGGGGDTGFLQEDSDTDYVYSPLFLSESEESN